jgi:hypothetical protein
MTRRAFDTRGIWAISYFRFFETPYSDVLEHNTVPRYENEVVPGGDSGDHFLFSHYLVGCTQRRL